jgi:hypothetical protein
LILLAAVIPLHAGKPVIAPEALPERVEVFKVRTRSDLNKEIPFYLRVPRNIKPGMPYRLLFLCPHLNQEGLTMLAGSAEWLALADARDWFVMTCTFKQSLNDVQNRASAKNTTRPLRRSNLTCRNIGWDWLKSTT